MNGKYYRKLTSVVFSINAASSSSSSSSSSSITSSSWSSPSISSAYYVNTVLYHYSVWHFNNQYFIFIPESTVTIAKMKQTCSEFLPHAFSSNLDQTAASRILVLNLGSSDVASSRNILMFSSCGR